MSDAGRQSEELSGKKAPRLSTGLRVRRMRPALPAQDLGGKLVEEEAAVGDEHGPLLLPELELRGRMS